MKLSPPLRKRYGVDPDTKECYLSNKVSTGRIASTEQLLGCIICGPNSGCNLRGKHLERSWKTHRKTQYR